MKIIPISTHWSGKISVVFIDSNGKIINNQSSPIGFSYDEEIDLNSNQEDIRLKGWGNSNNSVYDEGTHSVEIWFNDKIIGKQTFTVSY